ncbi:fibrinogen-related protein [Elysia marginata]|uniref:Fibrinogen-related protein n=1 Tax=Elysia marginata TaxID=1093978 RepID=A0AAV4F170_9GAST|nr:fibrinogen-related protein [Elysia marginata]
MKPAVLLIVLQMTVIFFNFSEGKEMTIRHCKDSDQPLQLVDPFPAGEHSSDKFISMVWSFRAAQSTSKNSTKLMTAIPGLVKVDRPRWSKYQHWGLQLSRPTLKDVGTYSATMASTAYTKGQYVDVHFSIVAPPTLKTDKLVVGSEVNPVTDKVVNLTCGQLDHLGTPPVELVWKTPNGSLLNNTFKDGKIMLELGDKYAEGKYTCELKDPATATKCIPESERDRWLPAEYTIYSKVGAPTPKSPNDNGHSMFKFYAGIGCVGLLILAAATGLVTTYRLKRGDFGIGNALA